MAFAVGKRHIETVQRSLSRDSLTVNAENSFEALMSASLIGQSAEINALLDRGADVNSKDHNGWTPLMEAASKGHTRAVMTLLASGADVNAKSIKGWTALKATPKGNTEIIILLKQAGAEH